MPDVATLVEPAFVWTPPHSSTAGGEAAEVAESVGLVPDASQRLALDVLLAESSPGVWAAFEGAVVASRQNLKTALFQMIVLADAFLFRTRLIVWSAHEFGTATEAFLDLKGYCENYDHLRRRVNKVISSNGKEAIHLTDGSRIVFKARTNSGGRGLTGDRVILDEAFALTPAIMGALLPTMSAAKNRNPQVLYGSSAGLEQSAVLRSVRDRGRAGGDPSLAYLEWCSTKPCPDKCDHHVGRDGCVLDDENEWAKANPALDVRITRAHIRKERLAMPAGEFGRERLGRWDDPGETTDGLDAEKWAACLDAESQTDGKPVLAAMVAHDLTWSAIASASYRADGVPHVEVIDYKPGTAWVAARADELRAKYDTQLVVLKAGPKSSLMDDLDDLNVAYEEADAQDLTGACGVLEDRVNRGTLRHIGQPELDVSVAVGRRRPVGDAWTWALRSSNADISPIVAVTLALWGLRNTQPTLSGLIDPNDYDDE